MTTLREIWVQAKKDSIAKYPQAVDALRKRRIQALEKESKKDPRAKVELIGKTIEKELRGMGIDIGNNDVDAYFRFKEDFGPTLDKYEKTKKSIGALLAKIGEMAKHGSDELVAHAESRKLFELYCTKRGCPENFEFVANRCKDRSIANLQWACDNLNVPAKLFERLKDLAKRPQDVARDAPALFADCRKAIDSATFEPQDPFIPFCEKLLVKKANLPALGDKAHDIGRSYREQIVKTAKTWEGIKPDFRAPLLKALDTIDPELQH